MNHAAPAYTAAYTNSIHSDQAEPLDVLAALLLSLTTAARLQLITAVIRQAIGE